MEKKFNTKEILTLDQIKEFFENNKEYSVREEKMETGLYIIVSKKFFVGYSKSITQKEVNNPVMFKEFMETNKTYIELEHIFAKPTLQQLIRVLDDFGKREQNIKNLQNKGFFK